MKPEEKQLLLEVMQRIGRLESENEKLRVLLDVFYRLNYVDKFLLEKPLVLRNTKIRIEGENGLVIGENTTDKLGFFGETPATQPTALTAQLTSITHTAPGTPDYAVQDLVNVSGYGFVTKDEGNTVLSVIKNLQVRVAELETKIKALGLIA